MKLLRWIAVTSGGMVRVSGFGLKWLSKFEFWKVFGAVLLLWLLHFLNPVIAGQLKEILK